MTKKFTTFEVAEMLGVAGNTIATWVDEGKLKAYTTPGGHRRIDEEDLVEFLKSNNIPIPKELGYKKSILIVEDDKELLESISYIIKNNLPNYEIITATDGFTAGGLFNRFEPEVVVLDIMLPYVNGFDVCRKIRETNDNTKILAISGNPTEENISNILKNGANDFLPKPFSEAELMSKIKSLIK